MLGQWPKSCVYGFRNSRSDQSWSASCSGPNVPTCCGSPGAWSTRWERTRCQSRRPRLSPSEVPVTGPGAADQRQLTTTHGACAERRLDVPDGAFPVRLRIAQNNLFGAVRQWQPRRRSRLLLQALVAPVWPSAADTASRPGGPRPFPFGDRQPGQRPQAGDGAQIADSACSGSVFRFYAGPLELNPATSCTAIVIATEVR